jgi:asparagine synthase (glutamine-hydrolysing)
VPLTVKAWLQRDSAGPKVAQPTFPAWISSKFDQRLGLRARWDRIQNTRRPEHPIRPYAYRSFNLIAHHLNLFEFYDAGTTRCHLEYRHPLMDLRLLEYCLSLPPQPWCSKKNILRIAMRGLLPDAVRARPKTALAGSPNFARMQRPQARWIDSVIPHPRVNDYVDNTKIPTLWGALDADELWKNLRPLSLDLWIKGLLQGQSTP